MAESLTVPTDTHRVYIAVDNFNSELEHGTSISLSTNTGIENLFNLLRQDAKKRLPENTSYQIVKSKNSKWVGWIYNNKNFIDKVDVLEEAST